MFAYHQGNQYVKEQEQSFLICLDNCKEKAWKKWKLLNAYNISLYLLLSISIFIIYQLHMYFWGSDSFVNKKAFGGKFKQVWSSLL